jgi:transcriptional regulator with GAF, ATPase, and Fis domain
MSVLDDFRDAEQRIAQRLKELAPAVDEYRELEVVAQRLGLDSATASQAAAATPARAKRRRASRTPAKGRPAASTSSPAKPTSRRTRRSAPPGQREQQLLELVRERPGVTVADAGKALGVDPTGLYRVVRRLEERGELRKNGRSLELAGAGSPS